MYVSFCYSTLIVKAYQFIFSFIIIDSLLWWNNVVENSCRIVNGMSITYADVSLDLAS